MLLITADSDFEQEALNTHNRYREVHGVAPMVLDRGLSNQAKAYTQKIANMGQFCICHRLKGTMLGRIKSSVSQILAYTCSSKFDEQAYKAKFSPAFNGVPPTGEAATKMWYVPHSQLYFFEQIINATDC